VRALIVLILTLGAAALPAASTAVVGQEFAALPEAGRLTVLRDVAMGTVNPPAAVLTEILRQGMEDSSEETRTAAISAVSARLLASRARGPSSERLLAEREALVSLRPALLGSLRNPNQNIRHAAVLALGHLGLREEQGGLFLDGDTTTLFAGVCTDDSSPKIRAEVIKTFALLQNKDDVVIRVLEQALLEETASVLQPAILGVARLRHVVSLNRIVMLLSSTDRAVRLAAAQAMAALLPASRAYAAELERLASVEVDAVVKQTMLGSLQAMRQ
jgi:HEAT repeat protein